MHSIARDDDNDTRLFETLEHYILEHYPNPERVGCLGQDVLTCFVETPEQLDLSDPKYLHVFKCAECTQELRDLRRLREERIRQEIQSSTTLPGADIKAIEKWGRRIIERLKSIFR